MKDEFFDVAVDMAIFLAGLFFLLITADRLNEIIEKMMVVLIR